MVAYFKEGQLSHRSMISSSSLAIEKEIEKENDGSAEWPIVAGYLAA